MGGKAWLYTLLPKETIVLVVALRYSTILQEGEIPMNGADLI